MSTTDKTDPRVPISVFTITQNAADCAGLTIREMCQRFQEVNVVLGPSEDATEAIVCGLEEEYAGTLNVQFHEFDTHAAQYQRALDMCTRDWILQLSSDEFLMPGIDWDTVLNDETKDGYKFNRYHVVYSLGHHDKRCYPDVGMRLARKGECGVTQTSIHEAFRLTGNPRNGRMKQLDQHIIDIGDIRCEDQLIMKAESRIRWYAGDLWNRKYFDEAGGNGGRAFLLRKADGRTGADWMPSDYQEYLSRVIPPGSKLWKELPCRSA